MYNSIIYYYRTMYFLSATLSSVFLEHVAEKRALLNGIIKRDVIKGKFVEPMRGHIAFRTAKNQIGKLVHTRSVRQIMLTKSRQIILKVTGV